MLSGFFSGRRAPVVMAVAAMPLVVACTAAAAQAPSTSPAPAEGARLFFASGQATLLRRPEAPRPPAANSALQPGDVLTTGQGRLQLALAGGARVALQPETEAQLPAHAGPAAPDLRLVAGTVRVQLAGPVFRLETLRGTVLVQGAAFSATYNSDGTITIASERTPVEVCTAAGCATAADDNVRVRSESVVPTHTNARPAYR